MSARIKRRPILRRDSEYVPSVEAAQREMRRTRENRYRRKRRKAYRRALIIALILGALAHYFCFDVVIARGGGMSPTIEGGSLVLCVRQSLLDELRGIIPEDLRHPQRNSLVLIHYTGRETVDQDSHLPQTDALLIRRVCALPGDMVDLAAGELILNQSEVIGEGGYTDRVYPVTVPAGRYFVMGDQRGAAIDSRLRAFGYVPQEQVTGRPVAVLWPLFALGPVK